MSNEWSLTSELCQAAGHASINEAAVKLALIEPNDRLESVNSYGPWFRGGAETYIFPFSTRSARAGERKFIIKAYTPTSNASPLELQMERMFQRRQTLEASGVVSPKVFYRGSGIWIEEYIPFTLEEALVNALAVQDYERQVKLLVGVCSIAKTLDAARYEASTLCSDLRAGESTVYMIDFGADLGEAGLSRSANHNTKSMMDWLRIVDHRLPHIADELLLKFTQANETRQ